MKRRKIDPETRMAAVLEGLRGESSIADICRQYRISESLHYRRRDKFLEGGSQAVPMALVCCTIKSRRVS
jgi:transposase-like protein